MSFTGILFFSPGVERPRRVPAEFVNWRVRIVADKTPRRKSLRKVRDYTILTSIIYVHQWHVMCHGTWHVSKRWSHESGAAGRSAKAFTGRDSQVRLISPTVCRRRRPNPHWLADSYLTVKLLYSFFVILIFLSDVLNDFWLQDELSLLDKLLIWF